MRHVVIMAKAPEAGRVKTRLAAAIGTAEAVRCYRALLTRTVRRLAGDRRWRVWLAITPDEATRRLAATWRPGLAAGAVIGQGRGGLGERMQRLLDRLPPGPVVIVGSDIPGVERSDIAAAFHALGRADAVFGPAADGGYWLVGQRRLPRPLRLFDAVRWSSEHALADTLGNLGSCKAALLRTLADVDAEADYRRWKRAGGMG